MVLSKNAEGETSWLEFSVHATSLLPFNPELLIFLIWCWSLAQATFIRISLFIQQPTSNTAWCSYLCYLSNLYVCFKQTYFLRIFFFNKIIKIKNYTSQEQLSTLCSINFFSPWIDQSINIIGNVKFNVCF